MAERGGDMFQWIAGFFHSLPEWYWVLMYAGLGIFDSAIILGSFGERHLKGFIEGLAEFMKEVVEVPPAALAVLVVMGYAPVASIIFAIIGSGDRWFADCSRWVGFQMMAVGAIPFLLYIGGRHFVPWLHQTIAAFRAKREHDPKRILALCKANFAQAKKKFNSADDDHPTDDLVAFELGGQNLLTLLGQLLHLSTRIDRLLAASEKNQKIETELGAYEHLIGIGRVDRKTLVGIRDRATTISKGLKLFFLELPVAVEQENAIREIVGIEGVQAELTKLLPKGVSSKGVIADLGTGSLQKRLMAELRG